MGDESKKPTDPIKIAEDGRLLLVLKQLHDTLELIAISVRVNDDVAKEHTKTNNRLMLYKILAWVFGLFFGIPCLMFVFYVILILFKDKIS